MNEVSDGRRKPPVSLKNWGQLALGIVLIYLFGAFFVPWWNALPMVSPLAVFIDENDFDPSAIFYTDVKETVDAEFYIRDALRYSVRKPK